MQQINCNFKHWNHPPINLYVTVHIFCIFFFLTLLSFSYIMYCVPVFCVHLILICKQCAIINNWTNVCINTLFPENALITCSGSCWPCSRSLFNNRSKGCLWDTSCRYTLSARSKRELMLATACKNNDYTNINQDGMTMNYSTPV